MLKDRIKQLCKSKNVTMAKVEADLGFAKGYLSKLDTSTPNGQKLSQIADYFGVSVDYLLGVEKSEHLNRYYINDETASIAQAVFDDPDLRLLFDAAIDADKDNIRLAAEMLRRFKKTNRDG